MAERWRCFPVALCVLSLSCGGKKPEAPDRGGPAAAGKQAGGVETTSPDARPAKDTSIAKFRIGAASAPDGIVSLETRSFVRGDSVFTSFEVPNAPPGSKIRVSWYSMPDRKPIASQEAPLGPDKPAVAFKADSKAWPIGDYELEMSLVEAGKENARFMGTAQFKIIREKLN